MIDLELQQIVQVTIAQTNILLEQDLVSLSMAMA